MGQLQCHCGSGVLPLKCKDSTFNHDSEHHAHGPSYVDKCTELSLK